MDTRPFMKFFTYKKFHQTVGGKITLALLCFFLAVSLLLTPWGNLALKPLIQKRLTALSATEITVRELRLGFNKFHIVCTDSASNILSAHGGFSLLTLRMYGHYDLLFTKASLGANPFPFTWKTSGALSGGIAAFDIIGRAIIGRGEIHYLLELHRFNLSIIDLKIDSVPLAPFIRLMHYPADNDTTLYGKLHLSGIDKRDIKGQLSLKTRTEHFTPTQFLSNDSNESLNLKKLLADENGIVSPFKIDLTANIFLNEAGVIEQFVGIPLHGEADLSGFIQGDEKHLILHAHSTLSDSNTHSTLTINDLEPSHLSLHIQHADIGSLFHFLTLPAPLEGKLKADADLTPKGGLITLSLANTRTVPKVLRDDYNLTQPATRFNASLSANLSGTEVHYNGLFKSDLTRMEIDNTTTHDQMLRELLRSIR